MDAESKNVKALEKGSFLYCCLGESLFAVQLLEDALSHTIVIKETEPHQKKEADILLNEHRSYTFGKALNIAKRKSLLPGQLLYDLSDIRLERNWLIHKSITENKNEYGTASFYRNLIEKTRAISSQALHLRINIELDLIEYCQNRGISMNNVKNLMKNHYGI